jgi:hypothetical protein
LWKHRRRSWNTTPTRPACSPSLPATGAPALPSLSPTWPHSRSARARTAHAPHSTRKMLTSGTCAQANAARFGGMEAQLQVLYSMMDLRFHDAHPLPASTTDILRELQNRYYSIPYAGIPYVCVTSCRASCVVCVCGACRAVLAARLRALSTERRGDEHAGELWSPEWLRGGLLQLPLLPRLLGQHLAPLLRARPPQPTM